MRVGRILGRLNSMYPTQNGNDLLSDNFAKQWDIPTVYEICELLKTSKEFVPKRSSESAEPVKGSAVNVKMTEAALLRESVGRQSLLARRMSNQLPSLYDDKTFEPLPVEFGFAHQEGSHMLSQNQPDMPLHDEQSYISDGPRNSRFSLSSRSSFMASRGSRKSISDAERKMMAIRGGGRRRGSQTLNKGVLKKMKGQNVKIEAAREGNDVDGDLDSFRSSDEDWLSDHGDERGSITAMPDVRIGIENVLADFIGLTNFGETHLLNYLKLSKQKCDEAGLLDGKEFHDLVASFYPNAITAGSREEINLTAIFDLYAQFDGSLDTSVVDYREMSVGLAKSLSLAIDLRVRVVFDTYDIDDSGEIDIQELCALMHKGHQETADMVEYTEKFFEIMDADGDGEISWDEFKNAVSREPLILESFSRCLPESVILSEADTGNLRNFVDRAKLSWTSLKQLWIMLRDRALGTPAERAKRRLEAIEEKKKNIKSKQGIGKDAKKSITIDSIADMGIEEVEEIGSSDEDSESEDEPTPDAFIDVLLDQEPFLQVMFLFLKPPSPTDGPLVRKIFKCFAASSGISEPENTEEMISPALAMLRKQNKGLSGSFHSLKELKQISRRESIQRISKSGNDNELGMNAQTDCRELVTTLATVLLVKHVCVRLLPNSMYCIS